MSRNIPIICALAVVILAATAVSGADDSALPAIQQALEHNDRLPEDRARDPARKPAEVLSFFRIGPGMTVIDFGAGGGYFSDLAASIVGPKGLVIAQNPYYFLRNSGDEYKRRFAPRRLGNVVMIFGDSSRLRLPSDSVDVAFFVDTYHDLAYDAPSGEGQSSAAAAALAEARRILKPGGILGIIDHRARPDTKRSDAAKLHRIAEPVLRSDLEAAGFRFEAAASFLANAADRHEKAWFEDAALRDNTDRMVFRYLSPD
jgi:predicted methyltransferase